MIPSPDSRPTVCVLAIVDSWSVSPLAILTTALLAAIRYLSRVVPFAISTTASQNSRTPASRHGCHLSHQFSSARQAGITGSGVADTCPLRVHPPRPMTVYHPFLLPRRPQLSLDSRNQSRNLSDGSSRGRWGHPRPRHASTEF